MEVFLVKNLPFLLMFGLIASNAVNDGPLQEKMKKGRKQDISGISRSVYPDETQDCYKAFFAGLKPPRGLRKHTEVKYICQKVGFDPQAYYATMFDEELGIPVFSAYTLDKNNIGFQARGSHTWREDPGIARQGTDDLYPTIPFHRGHLAPAHTLSHSAPAHKSTYKYTNAVPQRSGFNSGQWSQFERKIRNYAETDCIPNHGTLYLLTGSSFIHWGNNAVFNNNPLRVPWLAVADHNSYFPNPQPIAIPSSLWTAGCCVQVNNYNKVLKSFAVVGNNVEGETNTHLIEVGRLEAALGNEILSDPTTIKLFPAFPGCS